ncbi:hypothetical protein BGZ79_002138 [Entomortierella chlamydospora]|nr:hypothetical protein BGZ79_002138 [Entomortierella chlamydospora]
MTKSVRFPCNTGDIIQIGRCHIHKVSNRHEQIIGDNPINSHEPPLSEHSLKRKASHSFPTGRETPTKSAKHIAKHIPDNQAASTSGSSPMLLSFKDVQAALQAYYEPYLNIRRVSGDTLGLESCYINLAIVEAPNQRQKDKEDLKAQSASFHRMPSYEKISMTNMEEPIPSEQLFDKRKLRDGRDVPKAILVQGRAGIGKTTLCKKLVNLSQNGLWRDMAPIASVERI